MWTDSNRSRNKTKRCKGALVFDKDWEPILARGLFAESLPQGVNTHCSGRLRGRARQHRLTYFGESAPRQYPTGRTDRRPGSINKLCYGAGGRACEDVFFVPASCDPHSKRAWDCWRLGLGRLYRYWKCCQNLHLTDWSRSSDRKW